MALNLEAIFGTDPGDKPVVAPAVTTSDIPVVAPEPAAFEPWSINAQDAQELRGRVGAAVDTCPIIDATTTTEEICRCGSTTWRDVPIHDGQSVRRDCGRCGRFIEFTVWYGNETLQKEK